MNSSLFTSVITVSSLSCQSSLPISAVIMNVWIWNLHFSRNTWETTLVGKPRGGYLGTQKYQHCRLWVMQIWDSSVVFLLDFGTHCSAGMALPLPAKPEWFHRDQCGDLWNCSSWLQRCFWAAGEELQEVATRTEPRHTSGCSHAGSG